MRAARCGRPLAPRVLAVAGALLLVPVAGCGEPDDVVYRDAAVKALEGALSEARTAELAGRLWADRRGTRAYASVVVHEGEQGVGADTGWFGEQQPPRGADPVRADTLSALDALADAVEAERVALDRADRPALRRALTDLADACSDVEALAGGLS